tara:strand:- start:227 stop:625 length:399 start_codon:yes stop_codon:yes gene_type:complete
MDKFRLTTLIDITETGARRGEDPLAYRQQQNFLTVLQTIGLRTNIEYTSSPKVITSIPREKNLGSDYKGEQTIWQFEFTSPAPDALTVDMLNDDFNLIPIITDLAETAKFKNSVFITQNDKISNTDFELLDK